MIVKYTDKWGAEQFQQRYQDKVRITGNQWLRYNGKRWAEITENTVLRMVQQFVDDITNEASATGDEQFIQWTKGLHKTGNMQAMFRQIEPMMERPGLYDRKPYLNLENGTLDIDNGELMEHCADHNLQKMITGVAFDKDAKCPQWEKFIADITCGDVQLESFLKRAVGYSLSIDTSEQALFLIVGSGSNGKSVFLNTISKLLGSMRSGMEEEAVAGYSKGVKSETFVKGKKNGLNNELVDLIGARFVSGAELDVNHELDEPLVKLVTGQDLITGRQYYGKNQDFRLCCKVWLSTNHLPKVLGTEHGIWRRIKLIPFKAQFIGKQVDTKLEHKLEAELNGILNWALDGYYLWQQMGLEAPDSVLEAVEEYRLENDIVSSFLQEKCKSSPDGAVSAGELYEAFKRYIEDEGDGRHYSVRTFKRILDEKNIPLVRRESGKFRTGIVLYD